jgi:hypothetical protein
MNTTEMELASMYEAELTNIRRQAAMKVIANACKIAAATNCPMRNLLSTLEQHEEIRDTFGDLSLSDFLGLFKAPQQVLPVEKKDRPRRGQRNLASVKTQVLELLEKEANGLTFTQLFQVLGGSLEKGDLRNALAELRDAGQIRTEDSHRSMRYLATQEEAPRA